MHKKGQLEFDQSMMIALGLGIGGGLIALITMKSMHLGAVWKIFTFLATTLVSGGVAYFIINKGQ